MTIMKFKGRNGGLALVMRNHIVMFRIFLISLLIFLIPTIVLACIGEPYFWIFLIIPLFSLILSFVVFLDVKYAENVFLSLEKKDHIFEIKNECIFKDRKKIKLIKSIKIYCYKNFLYMETSHSMFIVKNTDFVLGDRNAFLDWAKKQTIKVLHGY